MDVVVDRERNVDEVGVSKSRECGFDWWEVNRFRWVENAASDDFTMNM